MSDPADHPDAMTDFASGPEPANNTHETTHQAVARARIDAPPATFPIVTAGIRHAQLELEFGNAGKDHA